MFSYRREDLLIELWPEACRRVGISVMPMPHDIIPHLNRFAGRASWHKTQSTRAKNALEDKRRKNAPYRRLWRSGLRSGGSRTSLPAPAS
jgi:hypothetical protein